MSCEDGDMRIGILNVYGRQEIPLMQGGHHCMDGLHLFQDQNWTHLALFPGHCEQVRLELLQGMGTTTACCIKLSPAKLFKRPGDVEYWKGRIAPVEVIETRSCIPTI